MERGEITRICESRVLDRAAGFFGTCKGELKKYPDYEGAANLVYEYKIDNQSLILRISFTPERNRALIQAELDFINYLSENRVRVSKPLPSRNGNLIETVEAEGIPFHVVSFVKGRGMRIPDNGYHYRNDAPIEEYFRNWGQVLGQMHALAKDYQPTSGVISRPEWFELHQGRLATVAQLPERLERVQARIEAVLKDLKFLPGDRESFGLIHGDFNDGNFTVDLRNGDITVFDFDDCCQFWFMYEIASAWEGGIGRVMSRGLDERKAFMSHYMEEVLAGYNRENTLPAEWLERLPLFIQLIQVEELLHYAQSLDSADEELQGELNYKIKCLEDDIPYMGFFDGIYSPQSPFSRHT